ncbi:hypothetical protein BKA80DRAFT_58656 [Phyllosticta citrichinensis]
MKGQVSVGWLHFLLILLFIGSCLSQGRLVLFAALPFAVTTSVPSVSPASSSRKCPVSSLLLVVGKVESAAQRSAAPCIASHRSAAATLFRNWRLTGGALAAARWCWHWCRRDPTARS